MTKNVLVTISGLHYDDSVMMVQEENSNEANSIEVTTPATYYLKNGKHYIVYDEVVEGIPGTIKNRIKIDEGKLLDITKSGITNSHMVFETDKINVTPYQTPYEICFLAHIRKVWIYRLKRSASNFKSDILWTLMETRQQTAISAF